MLVGENLIVSIADPPGAIVCGIAIPLALNPLPCTAPDEIVTGAVPLFLIVTVVEWLVPIVTLPKLADDGLNDSVLTAAPCATLAVTPESVSAISRKHNLEICLRKGSQIVCGTTLVSGETAELEFCRDTARSPLDCIPPSGYGHGKLVSTERE